MNGKKWDSHYTGHGYPSVAEIEAKAKAEGFTHSYWASENSYHGMYNGDTVVVYCNVDDLPESYRLDAIECGKPIS